MAFVLPTFILALILLFIFYELLNIKNKKKLPPGPKGIPILGHLHLLGENLTQDLHKFSLKYGPIIYMKFGLVPTYVISSPESAEKILKTYDHTFASRPHNETAQYISYGQRNLIFSKYGAYWRNMRKLCTVHLLSNMKINSFQSTRSEEIAIMIKSIKEIAQGRVDVDLSAQVSKLSANLSCLMDMLVASIDTSSSSIEWMLSELLRNPDIMKKLQKELEEVVGLNRMVQESDLENLKYLNMVFKESFRLHAAAPLLLHEAMEDCMVDDFYIKKGSQVIVNAYTIHRDPNFWTDADKFLPERFLESNVDIRGRDYQLLPFGSGRRSCLGMQLALIIVRLVVAQLVHCFDWELPNEMQPKDLDMTEQFGIVTGRANHLMAVPTYRLQHS
ncbi:cytochrome P450 71AU50-like [Solanum stenotomum]|uniref:cytochrome P450 71AU50-like n=1 Tax=Solanum stenotomum TaxID=172797 RepID=UPI0020D1820B|nr:cytochrome P450 71AU50-like [Solanum stenotomum]